MVANNCEETIQTRYDSKRAINAFCIFFYEIRDFVTVKIGYQQWIKGCIVVFAK